MDLVERYLQAVKMWLPARQRKDIVAELREDIRSEIEESEARLGRKLDDDELAGILRRRGRPVVAAGRFRTQGTLIGTTFYPIYLLTLRLAAMLFLVLWAVRGVCQLIASHGSLAWLGDLSKRFWISGIVLFGLVTLAFAVLERIQSRTGYLDRWDPRRDLRHVPSPGRTRRSSSITELALNVAFALAWIRPAAMIQVETRGAYTWTPGATWLRAHGEYFYPILGLMLFMAALAFAELLHPKETLLRSWLRAGGHWCSALVASILVFRGWGDASSEWTWLSRVPHAAGMEQFPSMVTDVLVYLVVASIAIGASVAFAVDVVRIVRSRRDSSSEVGSPSVGAEVLCM